MAKQMKGIFYRKRKDIVYWYVNVDGKKVYCGKGKKGREMAEAAKAKEIGKKYEDREIKAGLNVKKLEFKTILELTNWYMELPSVLEKKSFYRKTSACVHLLEYFGNKSLNQAEGDEQERYRELRRSQGASDGTIDYEIGVLGTIFNTARRRKLISADMMPGVFLKVNETNPRRIVTEEEFEKLLEHTDQDFKDVLICGYESAMRSSEICNLTAGQVHLNMHHISGAIVDYIDLGRFDTKTGARRTVPVSPRLKEVLERSVGGLEPEEYIFTINGKRYVKNKITPRMKWACKRAKIPYGDNLLNKKGERIGIVFHCLRHTRTSKWVEMGFSDEIVRRATGHKSLEAYQKYIKLDPSVV
ncbi:MAG: site-specific integrase, partial [Candidatus Aminicenantes bacterium]|nr:site-specific integrase [Candidatus Aminicenantes bacterium]